MCQGLVHFGIVGLTLQLQLKVLSVAGWEMHGQAIEHQVQGGIPEHHDSVLTKCVDQIDIPLKIQVENCFVHIDAADADSGRPSSYMFSFLCFYKSNEKIPADLCHI